ncbi:MAG: hypothetical protein FWG20_04310, partial [Candidatus Cloacimonetes bacterium]|nr:hypothetical protein [Candidatus Cloacimonadota bacterium]
MKTITILTTLLIFTVLSASTLFVGQDNSFDYQSIQQAIYNSVSNDTIIVYPGLYYENIKIIEKNIFLGSLYSITGDGGYIEQTIIDGQKMDSVILCLESQLVTIEGFTIQNGQGIDVPEAHWDTHRPLGHGGGIRLNNNFTEGYIEINNNIITNNFGYNGGGIFISGSKVSLKGNTIFKNSSYNTGGGIYYTAFNFYELDPGEIYFSNEAKNSIFYNIAMHANDIFIGDSGRMFDIPLAMATYSHNDYLDIACLDTNFHRRTDVWLNITIETWFVDEVDADIYVSPEGDDTNSGLSEAEPLKTITMALHKSIGRVNLDINTVLDLNSTYTAYRDYV